MEVRLGDRPVGDGHPCFVIAEIGINHNGDAQIAKKLIDVASFAGCEAVAGPFHSALGYFSGKGPTRDEWCWATDSMRQVAEYAGQCKVMLALEYLNRFECYLLNTAADGARLVQQVNHPRCKMMYDTFHAHIEEKNTPTAIRALRGCLAHVHISENDRSTPGTGNVRWAETFDALHEIGYDGPVCIEVEDRTFGKTLEGRKHALKVARNVLAPYF